MPAPNTARRAPAKRAESAKAAEREALTISTIRFPVYLSDQIADYLHAHRGDTMQSLIFKGLKKMGLHVEDEDLVPKRQRRAR